MQQQEGPCEAHSTCQHKQREVRSQRLPAQHEEIIEPSLPVGLPSALHLLPYFSDQRLSLSNTQEKAHTYTHGRLWQCCDLHTVCVPIMPPWPSIIRLQREQQHNTIWNEIHLSILRWNAVYHRRITRSNPGHDCYQQGSTKKEKKNPAKPWPHTCASAALKLT